MVSGTARGNVSRQIGGPGSRSALSGATVEPAGLTVTTPRAALVKLAQTGDRPAFAALVECWLEPGFRMALAILGNEADARDATQDAFLRAWRDLRQLRDPERFDAWFSRILVNSCRGLRRGRRRVAIREIDLRTIPARDEPAIAFEAAWDEQAASLDGVEHAFEQLSIPERTILVLHHLEHRPLREIAAALGIPVGTAKSRLFTARQALVRALEAELR